MALAIRLSPQAEEDLLTIWVYIAADNVTAADKLILDLESGWEHLAEFPLSGEARTDIHPDIRHQVKRGYVTLYQVEADAIIIVRVIAPKSGWDDEAR